MAFFNRGIASVALMAALGACASTSETAPPEAAAPAAAISTLDKAIAAAGGQAALAQVKELEWTGTATVNAEGKTTVIDLITVVRPQSNWARTTSWPKEGGSAKTGRTIQAENGKAWTVNRVSWTPMTDAQATHEYQKFGLYTLMLLAPLKDPTAKVTEQPVGADGTRAVKAVLQDGRNAELEFDAAGKLVRAGMVVKDPNGGADIVETVKFSGEIVSNGVKWPKRISIEQGGKPYFDLEIATFEANTAPKPRPLAHTLDEAQTPPAARGGGGG